MPRWQHISRNSLRRLLVSQSPWSRRSGRLALSALLASAGRAGPPPTGQTGSLSISSNSRHYSASHHTTPLICHYLLKLRINSQETGKMIKVNRRLKPKKRLKELSFRDKQNPVLKNIEVAGILSEIHPVAAGVYNTAYFVIINQKKQPARTSESLGTSYTFTLYLSCNKPHFLMFRFRLFRDK